MQTILSPHEYNTALNNRVVLLSKFCVHIGAASCISSSEKTLTHALRLVQWSQQPTGTS